MCIWDLQCFQSFRNGCLFCTYWLIRNFYSGDAHHANYGKRSLDHHFQHCAHSVYQILRIFKVFKIAVCFAPFGLLRNFYSGDAKHANYGKQFKSSFPTLRTLSIWDLQCFQTFRNGCLFCTLWLIRNFYSGPKQHVKYGKHSLNHHFQHCAHCVYEIYIVFEFLKIAVCFAHFGFFEIWTPLILTMLTMVNIVQIIISDIAHSVYLRFTVFGNFSKLLFVLHILAYSKFLLRWGASC